VQEEVVQKLLENLLLAPKQLLEGFYLNYDFVLSEKLIDYTIE